MKRIGNTWSWIRSMARSRALERGLDEELRFHIDQQTEKNLRAGLPPEEARRRALWQFGGLEPARERTRDEIRPTLIDDAVRDVRHGVRLLGRARGFAATALVTLALGIGATSAIFSVIRTVMLAPLPYHDPDRVVTIWETNRGGTQRNVIAPANFVAWRERSRTLDHLSMVAHINFVMIVNGQADEISGAALWSDGFRALGVQPALGRPYTAAERGGVIVLGHEFWQRRLGGRGDVVGRTLITNGEPRTVIGVMPAGFTVVGQRVDFLIPYSETLEQLRAIRGRGNSYAVARLRDGVSFDLAYSEMRSIYAQLEREEPGRNARRTVMLLSLQDQMVGELRPAALALAGAVALVLLVACVNVANLLLARSAARAREVGMRAALGAGRGRLVRQMLTESLVLAISGGIAGLGVAALCHRGLLALVGDRMPIPRLDQLTLDLPVVAFTLVTALATGIVFGLVPAFVSTDAASDRLREGPRQVGGRRLRRVLGTLVAAEVALSLVLLTGAGLLMRSFVTMQNIDPGFRAEGVLTAGMQLPGARYDAPKATVFYRDALSRVAALPGVRHAAGSPCLPPPGGCIGTSLWRTDRPKPVDGQRQSSRIHPITPNYFRTMEIPQVAGRDFAASDTAESVPVAIVSEMVARDHFPEGSPLGRRLHIFVDHTNGRDDVEWTIVGVVRDLRSSVDGIARPIVYVPSTQVAGRNMRLLVRADQEFASLGASVTRIMREMEPEAPVDVRTLEELVGNTIARPRAISLLVGAFALVALVLAAVGVYGVMAYSVRERTQEIGVRMALGATTTAVFRLVVVAALRLVLVGIAAGLVAAAALTRMLEGLLYEVEPLDPWTFVTTSLTLLIAAGVASYLPARRSARIAPVEALRAQ